LAYNWSADEEQLMLEGLEKYGLGNWVTVSDEVILYASSLLCSNF